MKSHACCVFLFLISSLCAQSGQKEKTELPSFLNELKGQWFLSYQHSKTSGQFNLKRGYLTIQRQFTDKFSGRITPDISVDREGDGEGDVELRLKYLYLRYKLPNFFYFNESYIEFGLVHRPWIDFEEHINRYRVQGTMFLERYNIVNSADYGITLVSLFGSELNEEYRLSVNPHYAGRYGSMSLGIYNGGGYHAIEQNANKTIESRITIRPIPEILPGMQFSYSGAFGKGNASTQPDWNFNSMFMSLENIKYVLTIMYYNGSGNHSGTAVDTSGMAYRQEGYSLFMEFKLLESGLSMIGRFDQLKRSENINNIRERRFILGIAYNLFDGGKIVIDYDKIIKKSFIEEQEDIFEVAFEIKY